MLYDKSEVSRTLFLLRSNSYLKYNGRQDNYLCPACNTENDSLEHLILNCPFFEDLRQEFIQSTNIERCQLIEYLLCFNNNKTPDTINKAKTAIGKLWKRRQKHVLAHEGEVLVG